MIRRRNLRRGGLAALAIGGLAMNGCALVPVAALGVAGNVADIGSAAFTAGTEVFSGGKLGSVEFATFDQVKAAIRSTLNDLRLPLKSSDYTKKTAIYAFVDEAGSAVAIDVKRRSPAICEIQINVGYFGSEAYARLLLKSVRARLPIVAAHQATQPVQPTDLQKPRVYPGFSADNLDR